MSIPTFETHADQLQRDDLDDRFLSTNHVMLWPDRMTTLKAYLQELFWVLEHNPKWLQQPHVPTLITHDVIPLLIRSIPIHRSPAAALKPSRRAKLMGQAEQIIWAHLEQPLTLKALAQGLGSSSSALSYGFQDLFGMGPHALSQGATAECRATMLKSQPSRPAQRSKP